MCCRPMWAAVCCCSFLAAVAVDRGRLSADDGVTAELPSMPVSQPVQRQVVDFVDFVGKTEASQTVKIIPRVTGYLTKTAYKEGSEVKRGDLLFEIDPRPLSAKLDQAESQLAYQRSAIESGEVRQRAGHGIARCPARSVKPISIVTKRPWTKRSPACRRPRPTFQFTD